ncbi:MAG: PDZ domain-containing protein [Acidobacteria bacterium]|nr:PDZ domain-containing protein [Acidobacteriota bacterium]
MNRSRLLFLVCSALLVLPMLMALVLAADPGSGRRADWRKSARGAHGETGEEDTFDTYLKYLKVFSEVLGLIRDTYVDEPNTEALMAGALEGVTDAMDPFSVYVPGPAVPGYVKALAAGKSLSGLALLKERGATLVMSVEKGSPADAAGLKVNDLVAKLDGTSTRTTPLWEMQEALAGPPGTKVSLEVIRLGTPVQASFDLKPFTPPAVSLSQVGETPDPEGAGEAAETQATPKAPANPANPAIGAEGRKHAVPPKVPPAGKSDKSATVLRIPSFRPGTADQVRGELGARGTAGHTPATADSPETHKLVIDLRGVSSGDPEQAYEVAKLFASGELGAMLRRKQELRRFDSSDTPVWQGRLVVLVDRGTAGPAEVFASVLRQRAGAELVGEHTLGYAGHRATADLSTGSRLFFTDAFYTGPDKKPINESLKPDEQVSERSRTLLEKDLPMSELILRRGVRHLLDEPALPASAGHTAKKAA